MVLAADLVGQCFYWIRGLGLLDHKMSPFRPFMQENEGMVFMVGSGLTNVGVKSCGVFRLRPGGIGSPCF